MGTVLLFKNEWKSLLIFKNYWDVFIRLPKENSNRIMIYNETHNGFMIVKPFQ